MPILEIKQRICYKQSYFERLLENILSKVAITLPQPTLLGEEVEALVNGIDRKVVNDKNNKVIGYHKFFKDESDFLKQFECDLSLKKHVDEVMLLDIINSNKLYSENISTCEKPIQIDLVHYPLNKKYVIDFRESDGIDLFLNTVENFYNMSLNHKKFYQGINYALIDHGMGMGRDELNIKEINVILKDFIPDKPRPAIENYIKMFVKYFIK